MDSLLIISNRPKPRPRIGQIAIGCLIYPGMDQIDFTGPFEVLSRMPDTKVTVVGKELAPILDVQRLLLTPDVRIAEAGNFDVLVVPGSPFTKNVAEVPDCTASITSTWLTFSALAD